MASNRYISTFSLFATIILLIVTVTLGFVLSFMNFSNPIAWLFLTLFFGVFVTFIRALYSMSKLNKLSTLAESSSDIFSGKTLNKNAKLTTCPDYWTKNVVINPETNEQVIMCYNEYIDANGKASYLGGTLEFAPEEGDVTATNAPLSGDDDLNPEADTQDASFVFASDSIFEGQRLQAVRDMAAKTEDVVEGFKMYRMGDPQYETHRHTHEMVKRVIDGRVTTDDESKDNVDPKHTHVKYYGRGYHSHDRFDDTVDSDGMISRENQYTETKGNFENWISPYKTRSGKFAIEINLNKLNSAPNTCELANKFIWSDVTNNCSM